MSKHKWSIRIDFDGQPDGGGEMVLRAKTSKSGDRWKECRRAVVPDGVELKTYTAFCEMAGVAMGDDDTFWMQVFLRDVPRLYEDHQAGVEGGTK